MAEVTGPDETPEPVYGQCTACRALEVRLNQVDYYKDLSRIGESSKYPFGFGCELCD